MSKMLEGVERTCEELIKFHTELLHKLAKEIKLNITNDDLMQSFDYPEMESCPAFKYQEGIVAGIRATYSALRAESCQ